MKMGDIKKMKTYQPGDLVQVEKIGFMGSTNLDVFIADLIKINKQLFHNGKGVVLFFNEKKKVYNVFCLRLEQVLEVHPEFISRKIK